jgi:hypothetical protein
MKPLLALLATAALAACASPSTVTETVAAAPSPTTSSASPTYTPDPSTSYSWAEPTPDPSYDPPNPEAKACGLVHRALGLPAYSSRWDDVVLDAEDAAKSDAAYSAIVKAEDEIYEPGFNYEANATADLKHFVEKFC